jgi:protein-tyrosine sulfotransferase
MSGSCNSRPPQLALLVGAARSGTTLLRLLLEAHPEVGCPAEAGIPSLIQTLGTVWSTIDDCQDVAGERIEPSEQARAQIRQAVVAVLHHYCARERKRLYVDKSLDSVYHLAAVERTFPETRCILLFRHVMDSVASGVEASPWGFAGYGYLPFVQRSPMNFVTALVDYWLNHVATALSWEAQHAQLCHRVRYEDLVTSPNDVLSEAFDFLGVDPHFPAVESAFERMRTVGGPGDRGPGDHKVPFTSGVLTTSIGRGKQVPVEMIPPAQLEAVNAQLDALGYEPLTGAWNATPGRRSTAVEDWGARLADLMSDVQVASKTARGREDSFAVVAADNEELRWTIDIARGVIRHGDGEVDSVVTGTAQDLVLMLSGETNAGILMRSGRIRHLSAREEVSTREAAVAVRSLLGALVDGGPCAKTATPGREAG